MGGGTILRKFTTCRGTNLYLLAHGYQISKADIRLDPPQSIIRAMGGSCHVVMDVWNVECNLTDK